MVVCRAVSVRVVLLAPLSGRERFWPSQNAALAAARYRAMGATVELGAPMDPRLR